MVHDELLGAQLDRLDRKLQTAADDDSKVDSRSSGAGRPFGPKVSSDMSLRSLHRHGRNAKLIFNAVLYCDGTDAGLYRHPERRRRHLPPLDGGPNA